MANWIKDNVSKDIVNILCKIELITLENGKIVKHEPRDFIPDLDLDYDQLEFQLEHIPAQFTFWSLVLGEQEAAINILERKIKFQRATAVGGMLDEAKKSDIKMAKWEIDELIESHELVSKSELKLALAKRNKAKLKAVVDALKMKSECLRSLAGFKRQEKTSP